MAALRSWSSALLLPLVFACGPVLNTDFFDDGRLPSEDGGTPAPTGGGSDDGCGPGKKRCDERCVDVADPAYGCGTGCTPCSLAHGTPRCEANACVVASCEPGRADCNGDPGDGCESKLTSDPDHCGTCSTKCAPQDKCAPTGCVASCPSGLTECSRSCVDISGDADHCGACGRKCPGGSNGVTTCTQGVCGFQCSPGFTPCASGCCAPIPTTPSVVAGVRHTCALSAQGAVKCWGANDYGQLGDGSTVSTTQPVAVVGLGSGVSALAAGGSHTCALLVSGGVKCWGSNSSGQLGDNSTAMRNAPVDVLGLGSGVVEITAGVWHTCARMATGSVKCWGNNGSGELGNNSKVESHVPVDVFQLTGAKMIASSSSGYHTCAVTSAGGLVCWGLNGSGQVGDDTVADALAPTDVHGLTTGVAAVAPGSGHTCAVTTGGAVQCWGSNADGEIGVSPPAASKIPVALAALASGVAGIAAGNAFACARISGAVKCWGNNYSGQLGNGASGFSSTYVPQDAAGVGPGVLGIAAGFRHACALSSAGVKCWGDNSYGQLGDGTMIDRNVAVVVTGL